MESGEESGEEPGRRGLVSRHPSGGPCAVSRYASQRLSRGHHLSPLAIRRQPSRRVPEPPSPQLVRARGPQIGADSDQSACRPRNRRRTT